MGAVGIFERFEYYGERLEQVVKIVGTVEEAKEHIADLKRLPCNAGNDYRIYTGYIAGGDFVKRLEIKN